MYVFLLIFLVPTAEFWQLFFKIVRVPLVKSEIYSTFDMVHLSAQDFFACLHLLFTSQVIFIVLAREEDRQAEVC
jgi:hypothetical protein